MEPDEETKYLVDTLLERRSQRRWLRAFGCFLLGIVFATIAKYAPLGHGLRLTFFIIGLLCIFSFIFFVSTTKYGQWRRAPGPDIWIP